MEPALGAGWDLHPPPGRHLLPGRGRTAASCSPGGSAEWAEAELQGARDRGVTCEHSPGIVCSCHLPFALLP